MIAHLAVVIPARNEEDEIESCLHAVAGAILCAQETYPRTSFSIIVIADSCEDSTGYRVQSVQRAFPKITLISAQLNSVGRARDLGARAALGQYSVNPAAVWIAFTDADTRVPSTWVASHLLHAAQHIDCLVGTVEPRPATASQTVVDRWHSLHTLTTNHAYVFGANLGLRGSTFQQIGGIPQLSSGEDHALVQAVVQANFIVHRTDACRVFTSARSNGRAPGGFATFISRL
jgi:cellulose synthase/poly-beta-1,6-N-acetylglucosamine synthase-like glycosyltransferase